MSPASVNGVAEIAYTPFAVEFSSWLMFALSGNRQIFSFSRNAVGLYLACSVRQPAAILSGAVEHASRILACAFILSGMLRLLYSPLMHAGPARGNSMIRFV